MTLKYYHAEPAANSLKSMIPLKEKGIPFESVYIDLHEFEQHSEWFVKLNPEGQVPVLEHNGVVITHTTVINEYLEDVFPEIPLRPYDPVGKARVRYWNKFVDENVTPFMSMHGWHHMIGAIARGIEPDEFEKLLERIPLPDQRRKWAAARSGFSEAELANAIDKIVYACAKMEATLAQSPWLAGDMYTTADINFFAMCGMTVEIRFPALEVAANYPRLVEWRTRMEARPAVRSALAMPNHTDPKVRNWSRQVR